MFFASSYDAKYYIWYWHHTVHPKMSSNKNYRHAHNTKPYSLYTVGKLLSSSTPLPCQSAQRPQWACLHKSQPIHKDTHVIIYTSEHLNFLTSWSCMEATPLSHNLIHENDNNKKCRTPRTVNTRTLVVHHDSEIQCSIWAEKKKTKKLAH